MPCEVAQLDASELQTVDLNECSWLNGPSNDQLNALLLEVAPGSGKVRSPPTIHVPLSPAPMSVSPSHTASSNEKTNSWNVSRPGSSYSRYTMEGRQIIHLSDDVLQYIFSFLWPVRELFSLRLTRRSLKNGIDSLKALCLTCDQPVNWKQAIACDSCCISSCRTCAKIELMPKELMIKNFSLANCRSCSGRIQPEWESCPWCGTLRTDLSHSMRLRKIWRKPRAWIPHPCGHLMVMRRTCGVCIKICTQCRGLACEKCIWHDGSRSACFACTISSGS